MTGADPIPWLLEAKNPSARYLTLTGLLGRSMDDPEVIDAQSAIPGWGPARAILDAQWAEGYWMRPGIGYSPKYRATVWQVIWLAALGAPRIEALDRACDFVLGHNRLPDGRFSAQKTAQGAVACLNGNLLRAMRQLGFEDSRLGESTEALAEMAIRDRFHCRFNARSPKPARMRDGLPCAWGAVKVLGALGEIPGEERSPAVQSVLEEGTAFLLGGDFVCGGYPAAYRPSPLWHRFGFPLGYTSDLVELLEVLGKVGVDGEPRLMEVVAFVCSKRDGLGRWALEYTPDNTWASFGQLGSPNKWVTLRALRALKYWEEIQ
ncbi:MAG: nitrogen fixation protein NifH [Anaerolineae bacterium]|jgi:hypothetical protein